METNKIGTDFPEVFGYTLTERLYENVRTAVYRAQQNSTHRPVVIKLLQQTHPSFSELVKFRHQYVITQSLPVSGIVRPLALESWGNSYALVMEDFGGISLAAYRQAQPLSLIEILGIASQVADILHDLVQHGLIHKDIKPANILIHPDSRQVELIDFSIASQLPKETQIIQNPSGLEGTLAYLAPEQTGRMNRGVDYRADFYALGITLYELLTGNVPFQSEDPLALVHAHIAKQSIPPHQINPEIPVMVSDIVLKLMAKNAEARYQSALGLKHDLEHCLIQLKETHGITPFELATRDVSDRFLIPEKLYGREAEIQTLLEAFQRAASGQAEIMLVAGFSGIGKTAVINEVHKPITQQQGYFSKGKFDQFNRDIPFSGFVQAFRTLISQILGESDSAIAQWKREILQALGDNGQIIIDVIPELEHIIGPQPAAVSLSGTAAQNRFNVFFTQFVSVFTTAKHPLVIFLDDLQWADSSSLQLLQRLVEDATGHLLILGAYRDNEVFPAHPLMLTLGAIKKTKKALQTLTLQPLSKNAITHICADTLHCVLDDAIPLSQNVYQKTKGNPFFTAQFLQGLHQEGCIAFDSTAGHWQCDLAQLQQLALTDDVVTFIINRLKKLPQETQTVLQFAACIGSQFDLETLSVICKQSPETVANALWAGLQEGFVIPSNATYKFFQGDRTDQTNTQNTNTQNTDAPRQQRTATADYQFLHDRIQQSAYSLIPDDQTATIHYQIGQRLQQQLSATVIQNKLFEVVGQLNYGIELIGDQSERDDLAKLNLTACRKARAATAYGSARQYANIGLKLLGEYAWKRQYALTLAFHELAAESAALQGDFPVMEALAHSIHEHAHSLLDQTNIKITQIQANLTQKNLTGAIAIGRTGLQQLGIVFPENPASEDTQQAVASLMALIGDRTIESLVDLPLMENPEMIAAAKIASSLISATFITASPLYPLLVIAAVKLSIKYGNTSTSASAYVSYSVLACNYFQAVEVGVQFSQLAIKVADKLNAQEARPAVLMTGSLFSFHRSAHIKETLTYFEQGFETAIEIGNMEFAGYCAGSLGLTTFLCGRPLQALEAETRAYTQSFMQLNQPDLADYCRNHWQATLNLIEPTQTPHLLSGKALQESILLPILKETQALSALFFTYGYKLILAYLFEETAAAETYATEMRKTLRGGTGSILEAVFYFYDALIALAQYSQTSSTEQQTALMARADQNKTILEKQWAPFAPMNYQHKVELIAAERCRVLENFPAAMEHYNRAIALAKENDFVHEEGLANELAAKFYLHWGNDQVAAKYIQAAYYCYSRWEAKTKITQLEQHYPKHLAAVLQKSAPGLVSSETVMMTVMSDTNHDAQETLLDFPTVIKAAQAISQEIELEALFVQLMRIVVENAGAQTGHLLLQESDQWHLVAEASQAKITAVSTPLQQCSTLPKKVIQAAIRTQTVAVYDNLSTVLQFASEPYITEHQPKSALCLPINQQGKIIGILYLENNLTGGAFTSDRIELLQLLTSQAAISLENARLHQQTVNYSQTLEAEVAKKTQALNQKATDLEQALTTLQKTQAQLIQTEKMSSLGQMVAGVAHEINNPATFIRGNVDCTKEYIGDLLKLIETYQSEYPNPSAHIQDLTEDIDLDFVIEDLDSMLASMEAGSQRIQDIVLNLRNFSHLDESGQKSVDLHKGLESTLGVLKSRLQTDQLNIEVTKTYGALPEVTCYPSQINQVFLNILSNAIDAVCESENSKQENSEPAIYISTDLTPDGLVEIAISNNGPLIPGDIQKRIFDPFFTTKDVGSGTGLGLFVSYSIVKQHGGELKVRSTPETSTSFILRLPQTTPIATATQTPNS
ncbi:MAG: AAA family ATPase [Cyanobacteria bacterium J06631_12]